MAITRTDCLLLLAEMQKNGIDTREITLQAVKQPEVSVDVVRFINKNRPLDVGRFYEKLRKSYNSKRSTLYKSITRVDEAEPKDVLVTLSSLNLQVMLFAKNCEDQQMFLRSARFDEIAAVLYNYSKTYDIIPCIKLLRAVKADLKAFESMKE